MKYLMMAMALSLLALGCGKAPDLTVDVPTVTASPAALPQAAAATQTFTYPQAAQICSALKSWDPAQTNIQFPGDPGGYAIYLFTAEKITQNGQTLTTLTLYVSVSGVNSCVVTINGGKIVSIQ